MSRYRNNYLDAGLNDPGRWAHVDCELPPESFMEHEEFMVGFSLPFDLCMMICGGNKEQARSLHWSQWAKLKELRNKEND